MKKNEGLCDQKILESLHQEKIDISKQIELKQSIQTHSDKQSKRRFFQAVKRTADSLIDENRVKRRRLGAGPRLKLDNDDEEFLLNCIEAKATAHGRRQDTVMYLDHVVKKRDFKEIVNHHRLSLGKEPIKSSTTVYNRSRPRNVRSIQAKRHKGKWLFCCKKTNKVRRKTSNS